MTERAYTVMVLPGSRARLWRLKVRPMWIAGVGLLSLVCLVAAVALPFFAWSASRRASELVALKHRIEDLTNANQEIALLRDRIAQFETQATKFAMMAGVENLPSAAGVGGLVPETLDTDAVVSELEDLGARSSVLSQSFDLIERAYQDQSLLLGSTPSIAPVKGMISYGFGWRRDPFTGQRAFHKGLDVVAPRGTPVQSPADGIVTKASRSGSYGNVVFIAHGNGVTTRFAHLDGFAVKTGQEVTRGDVIGYLGNTGRSLGAHLHYEILVNNTKVNPTQYILDDNAM